MQRVTHEGRKPQNRPMSNLNTGVCSAGNLPVRKEVAVISRSIEVLVREVVPSETKNLMWEGFVKHVGFDFHSMSENVRD